MANDRYSTTVSDPLVIENIDAGDWDDEADLVIVGFGGAGTAAAIQARELGGDVIVLDRFTGGGATAFSGGIVYAGGTRFQKQAGYDDTAENMFAYLSLEESPVDPETLRRFCEGSNDDMEWLVANGVPFDGKVYEEKTAAPPDGYHLYYSGNEKVLSYASKAVPAPRGHRTVAKGSFTGYAYFAALKDAALTKGVRLYPHSPVRRLIVDRDGAVLGVQALRIPDERQAEHEELYKKLNPLAAFAHEKHERAIADTKRFEAQFSEHRRIRARGGVVLAAGGYINNLEMIGKHVPLYKRVAPSLVRLGAIGCDGSGIDLGRSVGGACDHMDQMLAGRTIAPPNALLHGILVDARGKRFINEDAYTGFLGQAIAEQEQDGKAWLVIDRKNCRKAFKQCLFPGKGLRVFTLPTLLNLLFGGTKKASSIEQLADKCGMDADTLAASISVNNEAAAGRQADPVGKNPGLIAPLDAGPFYAVNMSLTNKLTATLTMTLGGLVVDERDGAVQRENGEPVRGLYAAGRTAVGLCSKGYLSGMSLADTVFSGRRAARTIMSRINTPAQQVAQP